MQSTIAVIVFLSVFFAAAMVLLTFDLWLLPLMVPAEYLTLAQVSFSVIWLIVSWNVLEETGRRFARENDHQ